MFGELGVTVQLRAEADFHPPLGGEVCLPAVVSKSWFGGQLFFFNIIYKFAYNQLGPTSHPIVLP